MSVVQETTLPPPLPQTWLRRLPPKIEVVEQITSLYGLSERGQGVSFSLHSGDLWGRDLYAVSLTEARCPRQASDFDEKTLKGEIHQFLTQHWQLLAQPACCLGLWVDDNSMLFIEVAVLIRNRDAALYFGRKWSQLGIFYLGYPTPCTIKLPPPTKVPHCVSARLRLCQVEAYEEWQNARTASV